MREGTSPDTVKKWTSSVLVPAGWAHPLRRTWARTAMVISPGHEAL